jgi:hypothetical protein
MFKHNRLITVGINLDQVVLESNCKLVTVWMPLKGFDKAVLPTASLQRF